MFGIISFALVNHPHLPPVEAMSAHRRVTAAIIMMVWLIHGAVSPSPMPATAAPLTSPLVTPRPANATTQPSPPSKAWIAGPVLGGVAMLAGVVVFLHDGGSGPTEGTTSRKDFGPKGKATPDQAGPQQGMDLSSTAVAFDDPFRVQDGEILMLPDPELNHLSNPLLELERRQVSSSRR